MVRLQYLRLGITLKVSLISPIYPHPAMYPKYFDLSLLRVLGFVRVRPVNLMQFRQARGNCNRITTAADSRLLHNTNIQLILRQKNNLRARDTKLRIENRRYTIGML
jgi:hypothetical protein